MHVYYVVLGRIPMDHTASIQIECLGAVAFGISPSLLANDIVKIGCNDVLGAYEIQQPRCGPRVVNKIVSRK